MWNIVVSAKYPISESKATDVEISRGQACVETKQKENHWVSWERSLERTKAWVRKSAKKKKKKSVGYKKKKKKKQCGDNKQGPAEES